MKKLAVIVLALCMVFAFVACSGGASNDETTVADTTDVTTTAADTTDGDTTVADTTDVTTTAADTTVADTSAEA